MYLRENRSEAESLFNTSLSEISLFRSCAEIAVGISVCNVIAVMRLIIKLLINLGGNMGKASHPIQDGKLFS